MACTDPRTCLHCALADLVNERLRAGAVAPERAFDDIIALAADLIVADVEGPQKHRHLTEKFADGLPIAVTIMRHSTDRAAAQRGVFGWVRRIAS